MCEPTTIALVASLAISAAASTAAVVSQRQQAKAQTNYQQQLVDASNQQAENQAAALRQQEAQQTEAQALQTEQARRSSVSAQSSAAAIMGTTGAGGGSASAVLAEYGQQFAQYQAATARQTDIYRQGVTDQVAAVRAGADAQALSINAPVAQPNYTAAALNFASGALGAYRDFNPNAFQRPPSTPRRTPQGPV